MTSNQTKRAEELETDPKGPSELNSPKLTPEGVPTQRAISSATQAHGLYESVRDEAKTGRIAKAGIVAEKYNGGVPFKQSSLTKNGEDWRNNYSTGFLASVVDRVKPQLLDPIKNATHLTRSTLPIGYEDGANKSLIFQEHISKVIRKWSGWDDFSSRIAQDTVLHGMTSPTWMSTNWRPQLFDYGDQYFPEETGQHPSSVPFFVVEERILLCNFIKLIKDKEIAKNAGYNYENCVEAVNNATARREDLNAVQHENLIREQASMGNTFSASSVKAINVAHVIVQDYSGEIDLWTVMQNGGKEIRNVKGLHKDIELSTALITFQSGNGRLYGSKGLGRLLTNLHIAIDRLRNLGADQAYLSGLVILIGKKAHLSPKIMHPFIVLAEDDVQVYKDKIEFNPQAHKMMVDELVTIAESIAGSFIPPNLDNEGSSRTKIEAAQKAEREIAVKQGVLGRFNKQFSMMIGTMQRHICNPVNLFEAMKAFEDNQKRKTSGQVLIERKAYTLLKEAFGEGLKDDVMPEMEEGLGDPEAVNCIYEMLKRGLKIEEIAMLAVTPADTDDDDEGSDSDQRTLGYIAASKMSPFVDQWKAARMEAVLAVGEDKANYLLRQQDDPNEEATATRQQIIEFSEMIDGNPMPVSATDNHPIHRRVLYQKLMPIMTVLEQGPTEGLAQAATLAIEHAKSHIGLDGMSDDETKKKEMEQIAVFEQILGAAVQLMAKMQQAQGQQAQDQPIPIDGQPPQQPAAPEGAPGEQPEQPSATGLNPEDAKLAVDLMKVQQGDRKLALEEAKHEHAREMGVAKAGTETARTIVDLADKAKQSGQEEAKADLSNMRK